MCHVPPGNSGNAHTICINENAVATHLAHGCKLGSCEEVNFCSNINANLQIDSNDEINRPEGYYMLQTQFNAFPNPFAENFEIDLFAQESDEYFINLYSAEGRLVKTIYTGNIKKNEHLTMEIPSLDLEKGLYILGVNNSSGNFHESVRLIKK